MKQTNKTKQYEPCDVSHAEIEQITFNILVGLSKPTMRGL